MINTEEIKDTVTSTVNISFCCELLLKSMLNKGITINEHKLRELFDRLDDTWKEIIIEKMKYKKYENVFYSELGGISNSFIEWRYIYEKTKGERRIQFSFLNKFASVLMTIAHAKYFYENNEKEKINENDLILIEDALNN